MRGVARRHSGTAAQMAHGLFRATVPLCLCAALSSCKGPAPDAARERVYVPRGASLTAVTDSLRAHHVVTSPAWFRTYARLRGLSQALKPGLYQFRRGERWRTIIAMLRSGRTHDLAFTVPEGLTIREIADLAAARLRLARDTAPADIRDSFLAAARDPALRAEFGIAAPRAVLEPLEGYLLPETYHVVFDSRPRDVVRQMLRHASLAWDSTADRQAQAIGLSRQEVLTLASIVEAEARVHAERRRIAGVYFNRLQRRMPLQADPTVIYSLGRRVTRVLFRHLETRSPYNTYRVSGLPPGPINNPGVASIQAALAPEPHAFVFFVARPDGRHMFSVTLRQHADSIRVSRALWSAWQARQDSIQRATRDSLRRAAAAAPAPVP